MGERWGYSLKTLSYHSHTTHTDTQYSLVSHSQGGTLHSPNFSVAIRSVSYIRLCLTWQSLFKSSACASVSPRVCVWWVWSPTFDPYPRCTLTIFSIPARLRVTTPWCLTFSSFSGSFCVCFLTAAGDHPCFVISYWCNDVYHTWESSAPAAAVRYNIYGRTNVTIPYIILVL